MAYRTIRMEDLRAGESYRQPGNLVLDVRSVAEYRRGHVPGSWNFPVREVERHPDHLRRPLASFDTVYVHCSSGPRAKRAYDALERTGLSNLVHVRESGMPQWVRRRYPVEREISFARDVATGLAAGLFASLATASVDIVTGAHFSRDERRKAQIVFTAGYGLVWGVVYALVRRRLPLATSFYGLPYAVGFFLACDGLLAPLFRMSPGLQKIPAQLNAKELVNHIAWTASAEAVHRGVEKRA